MCVVAEVAKAFVSATTTFLINVSHLLLFLFFFPPPILSFWPKCSKNRKLNCSGPTFYFSLDRDSTGVLVLTR